MATANESVKHLLGQMRYPEFNKTITIGKELATTYNSTAVDIIIEHQQKTDNERKYLDFPNLYKRERPKFWTERSSKKLLSTVNKLNPFKFLA